VDGTCAAADAPPHAARTQAPAKTLAARNVCLIMLPSMRRPASGCPWSAHWNSHFRGYGGDTVAALAASTCCTDRRLKAVAVLSGAEWPPMPGRYFPGGVPPMLFAQGTADTINPPWMSLQLYRADGAGARYYLDLFGASHLIPYVGTNPVERLMARVTLAFFDRYVLGQADALKTMTRDGNVTGTAALVSGGQPPP
jgi:hypothetical protein